MKEVPSWLTSMIRMKISRSPQHECDRKRKSHPLSWKRPHSRLHHQGFQMFNFDTTLPKPLVILGLTLIPIGMIGQVLAISYEMFGMDSMKRGIVNRVRQTYIPLFSAKKSKFKLLQLITCYMALGFFLFCSDRNSLDLHSVLGPFDWLRFHPDR